MPPPAMVGFLTPNFLASEIVSATIGKSGQPDKPPPPNFANGETSVPNNPTQSILSGSFPHGIVLATETASQPGCSQIVFRLSGETKGLKLISKPTLALNFDNSLENNSTNCQSSSRRSFSSALTAIKEIKNGDSIFCQVPAANNHFAPGPLKPTAFSTNPFRQ